MTNLLDEAIMAEGYDLLKKTINDTVFNFWLHTGGDLQDMQGEASLEFVRCYHDWQPDRAAFKTLLINRIRYRLTDKARVELNRKRILKRVTLLDQASKVTKFDLSEFIDALSDDARMVVLLAFEIWALSDCRPVEIRKGLREYLRQADWSHQRIRNAFYQVRSML